MSKEIKERKEGKKAVKVYRPICPKVIYYNKTKMVYCMFILNDTLTLV